MSEIRLVVLEPETARRHWKVGSHENLTAKPIATTRQVGVMGHRVYVFMVVMVINGPWYQGPLQPRS
jgi:hypothetical protein